MSFNTITKEFLIEVQQGNVPEYSMMQKFGRNSSVENNVWSIVSDSNPSGTFPPSGSPVRIKAGGDPADSSSGVGARSILIIGLNTDLVEVEEVISTSGANASAYTTNSFWRIYRSKVEYVGTYNATNVGDIVIENTEDMLTISAGDGQTQHGAYTIPSGKTGQIVGIYLNSDGVKAADFRLMTRLNMTDVSPPVESKRLLTYWDGILGYAQHIIAPTQSIPALTDIWMEARGGGAGTQVSIGFDILLKDDYPGHIARL